MAPPPNNFLIPTMGFYPGPNAPQQPMRQVNRPRSLVSIVTHEDDASGSSEPALNAPRLQRNPLENGKGRKRAHTNDVVPMGTAQPLMSMNSGSSLFGAPPPLITQFPPPPLLNQPQSPLFQKGGNTTLIVRKIPKELNVEEKMREHFERFGRLVHVEVNYGGASDSALVRFSAPKEAHAAYKCPQPVFNNRFIRLYWFNGPNVNVGQTSKRPIGMMEPVGAVLSPKSDEPSLKRHVRERLEFMGAAPMVQAALKHDILISKENKIQDEAQLMDAGGAEKTGVTPGEKMQQAAVERKENQAMQSENLKVIFNRLKLCMG